MAESLVEQHPDITTINLGNGVDGNIKVDYSQFQKNKLF